MNTTVIITLTAATVILGRWAQGKSFSGSVVIGAVVVIVFLYILDAAVPEVARPMALITLIAALLNYGSDILAHVGGTPTGHGTLNPAPGKGTLNPAGPNVVR